MYEPEGSIGLPESLPPEGDGNPPASKTPGKVQRPPWFGSLVKKQELKKVQRALVDIPGDEGQRHRGDNRWQPQQQQPAYDTPEKYKNDLEVSRGAKHLADIFRGADDIVEKNSFSKFDENDRCSDFNAANSLGQNSNQPQLFTEQMFYRADQLANNSGADIYAQEHLGYQHQSVPKFSNYPSQNNYQLDNDLIIPSHANSIHNDASGFQPEQRFSHSQSQPEQYQQSGVNFTQYYDGTTEDPLMRGGYQHAPYGPTAPASHAQAPMFNYGNSRVNMMGPGVMMVARPAGKLSNVSGSYPRCGMPNTAYLASIQGNSNTPVQGVQQTYSMRQPSRSGSMPSLVRGGSMHHLPQAFFVPQIPNQSQGVTAAYNALRNQGTSYVLSDDDFYDSAPTSHRLHMSMPSLHAEEPQDRKQKSSEKKPKLSLMKLLFSKK